MTTLRPNCLRMRKELRCLDLGASSAIINSRQERNAAVVLLFII